jgi:hypothetical protein
MSAANAAAIRRRVSNQNSNAPPPVPETNAKKPTSTKEQKGLTLPQVISNLDTRIKDLENKTPSLNGVDSVFSPSVLDEFNSRFEILANELSDIKETIMKLQTFTMEVNKTLFDERIQILSDVGNQSVITNTTNDITINDNKEPTSPTSMDIKDMVKEELSNTE